MRHDGHEIRPTEALEQAEEYVHDDVIPNGVVMRPLRQGTEEDELQTFVVSKLTKSVALFRGRLSVH